MHVSNDSLRSVKVQNAAKGVPRGTFLFYNTIMSSAKVIRSICVFSSKPNQADVERLDSLATTLESNGYIVQTKRLVSTIDNIDTLVQLSKNGVDYISVGNITISQAQTLLPIFYENDSLSFNIDLAKSDITEGHLDILQDIITTKPSKTFNFTYTFNNSQSSPYFPSAVYENDGFSIGLQPTNLSEGCSSLDEWLEKMRDIWEEIYDMFNSDEDFIGIDSSIAPLFEGSSSFINFVHKLGYSFSDTVTTDIYTRITNYIKEKNPKPVGLCGMMLPCTEDFELTLEYEAGNFSIERNVFLSLHSGLGIDTYPVGIDESPERILEILRLVQSLSNKYSKPLSARFVSDGKARVGQKAIFNDQYLKDCIVQPL